MTLWAMLGVMLLGYLAGAEAMDGEAVGRLSLEVVGLVVTAFLFYLAFSGVIAGLSERWRLRQMKRAFDSACLLHSRSHARPARRLPPGASPVWGARWWRRG